MYGDGGRGEAGTFRLLVPFLSFGLLSLGQGYINTSNICTVLY